MATVAVSTPPVTTSAPTSAARNKGKKVKDDGTRDGIKRNRLRIDGKRVTKEQIKKRILDLIEEQARTPSDLAGLTGLSRVWIWNYCKQLMAEDKIEKEGQAYKKKGLSTQAVQAQRLEELSAKDFYQLPVMQNFVDAVKRQPDRQRHMSLFESICFGRTLPGWKINPATWREPETTDNFIATYKAHFGVKEVPRHVRMALRSFIIYGLDKTLEKSKAMDRGLSGKKDNAGAHKHIKLSDSQISKALDLTADDETLQTLLACWTEGFPRPERGLLIELNTFQFGKKDLQFAYVKGEDQPIIDQRAVQILKMQQASMQAVVNTMASMLRGGGLAVPEDATRFDFVTFKTVAKDFATFRAWETKTHGGKPYQKMMVDERKIAIVKKYVEKRKAAGFRYLFYDGKEDVKERQEGAKLREFFEKKRPGIGRYYDKLREIFLAVGGTEAYFDDRPAYVLRHIGAHVWLRRTNYNYGVIAAMGWDSIDTLMGYYGGMDEQTTFDLAMETLAKTASGLSAA